MATTRNVILFKDHQIFVKFHIWGFQGTFSSTARLKNEFRNPRIPEYNNSLKNNLTFVNFVCGSSIPRLKLVKTEIRDGGSSDIRNC